MINASYERIHVDFVRKYNTTLVYFKIACKYWKSFM